VDKANSLARIDRWPSDVQSRGSTQPAPAEDEVRERLFPGAIEYFAHGQTALRSVRSRAESYLQSRLGLNLGRPL